MRGRSLDWTVVLGEGFGPLAHLLVQNGSCQHLIDDCSRHVAGGRGYGGVVENNMLITGNILILKQKVRYPLLLHFYQS